VRRDDACADGVFEYCDEVTHQSRCKWVSKSTRIDLVADKKQLGGHPNANSFASRSHQASGCDSGGCECLADLAWMWPSRTYVPSPGTAAEAAASLCPTHTTSGSDAAAAIPLPLLEEQPRVQRQAATLTMRCGPRGHTCPCAPSQLTNRLSLSQTCWWPGFNTRPPRDVLDFSTVDDSRNAAAVICLNVGGDCRRDDDALEGAGQGHRAITGVVVWRNLVTAVGPWPLVGLPGWAAFLEAFEFIFGSSLSSIQADTKKKKTCMTRKSKHA
jgi:hypothetical protein